MLRGDTRVALVDGTRLPSRRWRGAPRRGELFWGYSIGETAGSS